MYVYIVTCIFLANCVLTVFKLHTCTSKKLTKLHSLLNIQSLPIYPTTMVGEILEGNVLTV